MINKYLPGYRVYLNLFTKDEMSAYTKVISSVYSGQEA